MILCKLIVAINNIIASAINSFLIFVPIIACEGGRYQGACSDTPKRLLATTQSIIRCKETLTLPPKDPSIKGKSSNQLKRSFC